MAEIIFPASTAPSLNPTENGGRLINAYAEKAPTGSRSKVIWRRAPGLDEAFTAGIDVPRGAIVVDGVLYVANGATVFSVTKAGVNYTVTALSGVLDGSGPVFMAHNMRSPKQILIVHSAGMAQIIGSVVSSFSDPDLPSANSITFIDGYFIVSSADGRAFASALNNNTFSSIDFATAEAQPDGLVRVVAAGRDLLMMGETTIEFWSNAGNPTGFPFARGPVLPIGLASKYAVAGFEGGFPADVALVGSDKGIYQLSGYSPKRISRSQDERLIEAVSNPDDLRASVYVAAGHPCWVLKSPDWTLVHDMSTGEWHERASIGRANWRASFGINAFNEWLTFDDASGVVYRVNDRSKREAGGPLVMDIRSTQQHRFPGRTEVPRVDFDFVVGVGIDAGIDPIETNPVVSVSWSNDGGRTFGNALLRELGTQGAQRRITVNRTGLTGPQGRQWRLQISDPVEVGLLGGSIPNPEERAP